MKKIFAVMAAFVAAVCCLGGCNKNNGFDEYAMLNDMLNVNYSQFVLNITDTFDDDTSLNSSYSINVSEDVTTIS